MSYPPPPLSLPHSARHWAGRYPSHTLPDTPIKRSRGRPRKVVEDARLSLLNALFDDTAERATIVNMISISQQQGEKGVSTAAITAATWLWDRKYGKVTEKVQSDNKQQIVIEYAEDPYKPA